MNSMKYMFYALIIWIVTQGRAHVQTNCRQKEKQYELTSAGDDAVLTPKQHKK